MPIQLHKEEREGGIVATVVIDNPARLNVMNTASMAQLCSVLEELAKEERLRVLVLTGAGDKAFIGGADIREMGQMDNAEKARQFITRVHGVCHAIRAIPVPTIARLNGFTFGAGLEVAASCDLRIASDTARFGMPEVKLGVPSVVEAALLPMLIGWGRTRQMLMLGETIDARTAEKWGFVERVVVPSELDAAVAEWVSHVLSGKPRALRLQKELIRAWEDLPLRAAVEAGITSFGEAFTTDEPVVAMKEFLDKQASRKKNG